MFSEPGERHHVAHFHAYCGDDTAVYSILPFDVLAGSLPQKQHRLVGAWVELHTPELLADWELLKQGRKPARVDPLPQSHS